MVTHSRTPQRAGGVRALNQPAPVQVKTDQHGRPTAIRLERRWLQVREVLDTWRIDDEWWRPSPVSRLYCRVDLEGAGTVALFKDLMTNAWLRQRE